MKRNITACLILVAALAASAVNAASLDISIGIRETGGSGPTFSNAGASGGIEFVNQDGQSLVADGTWQQFTFTPSVDTLLAFAGATANGVLDTDWVSLEMIRVRNSDGITLPIRMWVDAVSNTTSTGTATQNFGTYAVGTSQVMFQYASFSGSTSGNIVGPPSNPGDISTSIVSDSDAFDGDRSVQMDFQFIDGTPTRWARITTFGAPQLPNPAFLAREAQFNPTISFWAKAVVIPEPTSLVLLGLAGLGLVSFRKRS